MRKLGLIALLGAFLVAGCANTQVKLPKFESVADIATPTVGYLIAKNNPEHIQTIVDYGDKLLGEADPVDFKAKLDEGRKLLLNMLTKDKFLTLQINKLLPKIEIESAAVPTPKWMARVKPIVRDFIDGVQAAS